jgi:hypothetical protein
MQPTKKGLHAHCLKLNQRIWPEHKKTEAQKQKIRIAANEITLASTLRTVRWDLS